MSVQNGERLATKQDLADMYQGILPYLGGMPEMLANKFSKGDLYSTDEKMIGQWIDGKPIYQKTFYINALTNKSILSVSHGISDIGELVSITGTMSNGTDRLRPLPYVHDTTLGNQANIFLTPTTFEIDNRGSDYSSYHAYVTIQYTKVSDTAISIGSDTDYSTEEKIVGTWIDGKPIYQKYYPSQLTLSVDTWVDTGISKGSISKIIGVEAYTDNGTVINSVSSSCDGINIKICSSVGSTLPNVHGFTLRYTKTTTS